MAYNIKGTNEIIPENQFEETIKRVPRSLSKEIAKRENIDLLTLFGYLPNPDPVLKKLGKDIEVYEDLSYDSRVKACVKSRKTAVKSMEWDITGDQNTDEEIQFHKKYFNDYKILNMIGELVDASLYGYKPMEILWKRDGNYLVPYDFVGKPQNWFTYDDKNQLRMYTLDNNTTGIELPPNKFVVASHEATYKNPYGVGDYSGCYWPVVFRKNGWRFYTTFIEKWGIPFLLAKAPMGSQTERINEINEMMVNMIQDAVATVPEDFEVTAIESNKGGGGEKTAQSVYIDDCNTEIAMSILGQNLSTEVQGGSYAATSGHLEVREDFIEADAEIVSDAFSQLLHICHRFNFTSPSPQFKLFSEEKVDIDRADRDEKLQRANPGFKFTQIYYERKYNLQTDEFTLENGGEDVNGQNGGNGNDQKS